MFEDKVASEKYVDETDTGIQKSITWDIKKF
jgi:hypothetical protein